MRINRFDLKNMVKNPAICFIAKRGSGKSWVARDLAYTKRHVPGGVVISPTEQTSPFYKDFFPDLYIHYEYKDIIVKNILIRQFILAQRNVKRQERGLKPIDSSIFVIMDDCLAEKKVWGKSDMIRIIMMNGRHYNITYMVTMQDPLGLSPPLRSNFDYVFIFKEPSDVVKRKIWANYGSIISNYYEFCQVLDACTNDYKCMVICNRISSTNPMDCISWHLAEEREFKFGSAEFDYLNKKYYDPGAIVRKQCRAMLGGNLRPKKHNNMQIKLND